jgi:hypothetical protein
MKRIVSCCALALLILAAGFSNNCILDEKVIEIVLNDRTCAEMVEYHESLEWATPAVIDYATEIDRILADNDLSREDIHSAKVMGGSYIVTDFTPPGHDWLISGYIDVERLDISDGPATVFDYETVSVQGSMGSYQVAPLENPGVELLNRALEDYLNGGYPVIEFEVHNGSVGPDPPTEIDPLEFVWQACITIVVTTVEELEAPDPF